MIYWFWLSTCLVVYVYLLYPLIIWAMARAQLAKHTQPSRAIGPSLPTITVVVPAYNEEAVIAAKLENCLSLDYPTDLLDIVVVSDGSTDRTDSIVTTFQS